MYVVFFLQGCDNTLNYTIPANWRFTILKKDQQKKEDNLPLQSGHTLVAVYYPEICGFCLNQIDMIKKSISSINSSKRKKNVSLVCVVATKDTNTMQYYLDEKIQNIKTIYIDNRKNFKQAFFTKKEVLEYPAYFVITGNRVIIKEKLNNKKSMNKLMSFF